jgi:hypothetical protein
VGWLPLYVEKKGRNIVIFFFVLFLVAGCVAFFALVASKYKVGGVALVVAVLSLILLLNIAPSGNSSSRSYGSSKTCQSCDRTFLIPRMSSASPKQVCAVTVIPISSGHRL